MLLFCCECHLHRCIGQMHSTYSTSTSGFNFNLFIYLERVQNCDISDVAVRRSAYTHTNLLSGKRFWNRRYMWEEKQTKSRRKKWRKRMRQTLIEDDKKWEEEWWEGIKEQRDKQRKWRQNTREEYEKQNKKKDWSVNNTKWLEMACMSRFEATLLDLCSCSHAPHLQATCLTV